jgi:translin
MTSIDLALKAKDEKREKVIALSREIIRRSGSAVLAVHRQDEEGANESLKEAGEALNVSLEICKKQPEFYFVGSLPQAFQEFAEASLVAALIWSRDLPSPDDLNVPVEQYATGLADAAGEMRRYALDSLRRDNFDEAERALGAMEGIYVSLKSLDFPRAVVPNLRRKVDVIRRLLEETRGDVTLAHQGRLIRGSIDRALGGGKTV